MMSHWFGRDRGERVGGGRVCWVMMGMEWNRMSRVVAVVSGVGNVRLEGMGRGSWNEVWR